MYSDYSLSQSALYNEKGTWKKYDPAVPTV